MRFAVIMQHADMAYHGQRAYKGPTISLFSGGWYRWFQKKIYWSLILSTKKSCKEIPAIQWLCMSGKNILSPEVWGKQKFLRKPMKSPIPWSKSNGRPLVTCRKSCYRLKLRLRHQSLIVHSRSKLVHVYSLLDDECNTAGRLGTF